MIIATFNVNSIKARLPRVIEWLKSRKPDVVCLQEIKCLDENFPRMEIEELGYNIETHGQKTYNGVAILTKFPIEDVTRGLPENDEDDQARYIECFTGGVRIGCLYLPNGNPVPGEKYDYKLRWMDYLTAHAKTLLSYEEVAVLCGDYNVIQRAEDVYNPENWADDALYKIETREKFRELLYLGYTDAFRAIKPSGPDYTFWDYQRGAWARDNGLRIDFHLLSPQAADRLKDCQIDKMVRAEQKASDHVPIWVDLEV
ncbi:MAG: exodeoxyribonuclease III [Alphaproteobacteria bacterium]